MKFKLLVWINESHGYEFFFFYPRFRSSTSREVQLTCICQIWQECNFGSTSKRSQNLLVIYDFEESKLLLSRSINQQLSGSLIAPFNFTTMTLDIIYPIVLTPIVFAVGYSIHCIKKAMNKELPEAKPYEFERDVYNPEFDQFSQVLFNHKFYKGKAKW